MASVLAPASDAFSAQELPLNSCSSFKKEKYLVFCSPSPCSGTLYVDFQLMTWINLVLSTTIYTERSADIPSGKNNWADFIA